MDQIDLTNIVNDLQRLIYSTRDTTVEENAIQTAHTLRFAFQRATAEFVRPAIISENGEKKNGQLLDQQLNLLKLENRALQTELENVMATISHVQQSHRATMEAVIKGNVPSQFEGAGWERHPLEKLLKTKGRKCEVTNLTRSEEAEQLRLFAHSVRQIVRDAEAKFFGQRDMTEKAAFENYVMRSLLDHKGEEPLDCEALVRAFREITPTDVPTAREGVVPSVSHKDILKASEGFEEQFWAEHEEDRARMEAMAVLEEERRRKEQQMENDANVVEGLLRQYGKRH